MITAQELLRNHVNYRAKRKKLRILITLLVINLVIFSQYAYIIFYDRMTPVEYEHVQLYYDNSFYVPDSRKECEKLVRKYYKIPHLCLNVKLDALTDGRAVCLPPMVFVDKRLSNANFITTYVHELLHIKHQTLDETYVSFMTFKTMYESGNETLRGCAMRLASQTVAGAYPGDYDCGYYILKYLKEN